MPGPFPGMDPYLEDSAYWHGMHNRLIFCASEALNIGLPLGYVADIEERLYVVEAERSLYPDVALLRVTPPVILQQEGRTPDSGTALLERAAPHGIVSVSTQRYYYGYWLSRVRDPLPPVRVPLLEGEPDTVLDLQAVFDRAYDSGRYYQKIDYNAPPSIPLANEDAIRMETLLREKGVRR